MNASQHRDTQYEIASLRQEPNSFVVECVERGVFGSRPVPLDLHESLFSEEEMTTVHEALRILEEKFAIAHAAKEQELEIVGLDVPRAKVQEFVRRAEGAKAEAARIEAENLVKRAEAEELDANLSVLRAAAAGAEAPTADATPRNLRS